MWSTNSLWFEVAIVSIIYAVGNIVFGHFEERTPKFRRSGQVHSDTHYRVFDLGLFGQNSCDVLSCLLFDTSRLRPRLYFAQEKRH